MGGIYCCVFGVGVSTVEWGVGVSTVECGELEFLQLSVGSWSIYS